MSDRELDRVPRQAPDGSLYLSADAAATALALPTAAAGLGFDGAAAVPPMAAAEVQAAVQELNAAIAALPAPLTGVPQLVSYTFSAATVAGLGAVQTGSIQVANLSPGDAVVGFGIQPTTLFDDGAGTLAGLIVDVTLDGTSLTSLPGIECSVSGGGVAHDEAHLNMTTNKNLFIATGQPAESMDVTFTSSLPAETLDTLTAGSVTVWFLLVT